jgi:hypothetical protein
MDDGKLVLLTGVAISMSGRAVPAIPEWAVSGLSYLSFYFPEAELHQPDTSYLYRHALEDSGHTYEK